MYCGKCGKVLNTEDVFCSNCGCAVSSSETGAPVVATRKKIDRRYVISGFLLVIAVLMWILGSTQKVKMAGKWYRERSENDSYNISDYIYLGLFGRYEEEFKGKRYVGDWEISKDQELLLDYEMVSTKDGWGAGLIGKRQIEELEYDAQAMKERNNGYEIWYIKGDRLYMWGTRRYVRHGIPLSVWLKIISVALVITGIIITVRARKKRA